MKILILAILLSIPGWGWLMRIHNQNLALAAAQAAYRQHQNETEALAWQQVVTAAGAGPNAPALLLNLAQAQLRAGYVDAARRTYGRLLSAPATISSIARQQLAVLALAQGQPLQSLALLREALRLDPRNRVARYNYEILRAYLDQQTPDSGSESAPTKKQPKPSQSPAKDSAASANQPKPGTDRPGETPSADQPGVDNLPPQPRPAPDNKPDKQRPSPNAGTTSPHSRPPGSGSPQNQPVGDQPGTKRGLDPTAHTGTDAASGISTRPGTETAQADDQRLQTQRERLKALNLTPTQARQILEELRAQEQQYLQQVTRPAASSPDPNRPTW